MATAAAAAPTRCQEGASARAWERGTSHPGGQDPPAKSGWRMAQRWAAPARPAKRPWRQRPCMPTPPRIINDSTLQLLLPEQIKRPGPGQGAKLPAAETFASRPQVPGPPIRLDHYVCSFTRVQAALLRHLRPLTASLCSRPSSRAPPGPAPCSLQPARSPTHHHGVRRGAAEGSDQER